MITLSVAPIFNELTLFEITIVPDTQVVRGQAKLTSAAAPDIIAAGTFSFDATTGKAIISIHSPFTLQHEITLTAEQVEAVRNYVTSTLATLENAFLSMGLVAGVRS